MAKTDERLFAPFAIDMDEHPKFIGLSDAAFRAVFEATFYARRNMTDGFLDERVVMRRWGPEVAEELSSNDPERPTWVRVDAGWQIHDFAKHHPLRAEIEASRADLRAKRSAAGKKGNAKRWQANSKPVANESQTDRKHVATDRSETETETETVTPNGVTPLTPQGGERVKTRGTRLVADWMPSAELIAQMRTECPQVDLQAEHRIFVDYWIAQPGQKGVKLDWPATWRNWMRRKQGDASRGAPKTFGQQKQENTLALVERLREEEGRAAVGSGDAPGVRALGAGW